MKKLTENIWYMNYDDGKDRPIIGFVKGKNRNILIDSGNSKDHVNEILENLEKIGVEKIDYVGVTHWHWDHTYGLSYIDGIKIGSKKTNDKLKRLKYIEETQNGNILIDEKNTFSNLKKLYKENKTIETLDVFFDKELFLDLGDTTVEFYNIGGDHSDDSSLIYIEKEKTMFLGDLTYRGFWNGKRYNSLENLEKIYKRIFSYDCDKYITSHKDIYSKEELEKELREMIEIGREVINTKDDSISNKMNKKNESIYKNFQVWEKIKSTEEKLI